MYGLVLLFEYLLVCCSCLSIFWSTCEQSGLGNLTTAWHCLLTRQSWPRSCERSAPRPSLQRHLSDSACNGICQTTHATAPVRQCMQRHLSDNACNGICQTTHTTASVRQCMQRHLSDNACNGICQTVHAMASVRQCMQRHLSDSACVISCEWLSMLHDYMKCQLGFNLAFTTEQDRAPAFPV